MSEVSDEPTDAALDSSTARGGLTPAALAGPRLDAPLIARPRLLSRLDTNAEVTVLRAPVGSGKTTLVAQWIAARTSHRPEAAATSASAQAAGIEAARVETAIWVRLRPAGDPPPAGDLDGFWTRVVDALTDAGVPLPPLAEQRSSRALAERMLTRGDRRLLLVVDGFENVTGHDVDQLLLDMVWHTPGLRLIVCLRSHRPFAAALLAEVDATELTGRDLLFTSDETAALLAAVGGHTFATWVTQVHNATGGWAEPTRALAFALRSANVNPIEFAATAASIASDYLHRRLLGVIRRPDIVEFALLTSLPDEFTVEVADLLTGRDAAKPRLEWLEGEGVLSSETVNGQPVYQWPVAARTALREEASYRFADRLPDLHRRLSHHYLDIAQPGRALRHAAAARDWPLVLEVINQSWRTLLFAHRDELFEALTMTPLDVLATSPRALAVRDVRLQAPDDRLLEVAPLPATPAELADLGRSEHAADLLDTSLALTGALRRRGEFLRACTRADRTAEIATVARALRPADVEPDYACVQINVGLSHLLIGDLTGALPALELAYDLGPEHPRQYISADAASKRALAHAVLGEPDHTDLWLNRYRAAPLEDTWLAPMIHCTAIAARLLSALDRLDRAGADAAYQAMPPPSRIEEFWAYLLYAQTQYALHTGAAATMLPQLDRARAAHPHWLGHGAAAGPLLAAAQAELLLAIGHGNQAHAILIGEHAGHPWLRVSAARLALLTGDHDTLTQLASDRAWQQSATTRDRLTMLLLHAIGRLRTADTGTATTLLQTAVDNARHTGLRRPFTAVPRTELAQLASSLEDAPELLRDPDLIATRCPYPDSVTLILLTEREQDVLEQLAEGLTVEQTAAALNVSYNTVKTHIQSLYRKIGSETRSHALSRANELGLFRRLLKPRQH